MTCDSIRNNAQKTLPVNQEFSQDYKSVEQGAILRSDSTCHNLCY